MRLGAGAPGATGRERSRTLLPMRMRTRATSIGVHLVTASVAIASLTIAACSGSDDDAGGAASTTSTAAAASTTSTTIVDDGVLRIGALLPLTGPGAALGLTMQASIDIAIDEINEAGGVGGRSVQLRVADEGGDAATAASALDDLVQAGVDAVVGPASSTNALNVLDTTTRDGVVTCSPTASALSLDAYPDDGLFFRTVPSDALQAEAFARAIDQTGRGSVGLFYVDDAYGRPFAGLVRQALASRSIIIQREVAFAATDTDFADDVVTDANLAGVEVVAVIGDSEGGPRLVRALAEATPSGDVPIVVNDTLRGATSAAVLADLPDEAISRVIGVGPRAVIDDPSFVEALAERLPGSPGYFAVNAFDCATVIALAARAAGSTVPREIAGRITGLTTGGTDCRTFADCVAVLDAGRNVDYDGPSGDLQMGPTGDPNRGVFDVFGFTTGGGEVVFSGITVSA